MKAAKITTMTTSEETMEELVVDEMSNNSQSESQRMILDDGDHVDEKKMMLHWRSSIIIQQLSLFLAVLQSSTSATDDKCPCMRPTGSSACVSYDQSIQATSLQEAIYTFPNFGTYSSSQTLMNMMNNNNNNNRLFRPTTTTTTTYACDSIDCYSCMYAIVDGFATSAADASNAIEWRTFASWRYKLQQQWMMNRSGDKSMPSCPAIQQQNPSNRMVPNLSGSRLSPAMIDEIVQLMQPDGNTPSNSNNYYRQRYRRQMKTIGNSTNNGQLIGVTTQLGCDYRRGQPIGNTNFVGLCNICWTWRKLPDNYFPPYLNEVNCDQTVMDGTECLSGFGSCQPVLRSINVLYNTGTSAGWQQQSIYTIASCECQIQVGSPLYSFVSR